MIIFISPDCFPSSSFQSLYILNYPFLTLFCCDFMVVSQFELIKIFTFLLFLVIRLYCSLIVNNRTLVSLNLPFAGVCPHRFRRDSISICRSRDWISIVLTTTFLYPTPLLNHLVKILEVFGSLPLGTVIASTLCSFISLATLGLF